MGSCSASCLIFKALMAPGWNTFWPSCQSSSSLTCGFSFRFANASTKAGSGSWFHHLLPDPNAKMRYLVCKGGLTWIQTRRGALSHLTHIHHGCFLLFLRDPLSFPVVGTHRWRTGVPTTHRPHTCSPSAEWSGWRAPWICNTSRKASQDHGA